MHWFKKIVLILLVLVLLAGAVLWWLAQSPAPKEITYGMSFNTFYARELGLDWQETYDAFLDDLGVRHLRLAAHWPMVEPKNGTYNFAELDYQLARAEEVGAEVILAVGRRLPRWPECHIPQWARGLTWDEQKQELRDYLKAVVDRYKGNLALKYWQVENEPYLELFAYEHCGELDEAFLGEEIELVRSLDPSREIVVTDSGNLGTWLGAYKHADIFGTSVYVHFWNPDLGQFRTVLPPWFYRVKTNLMKLVYGEKESVLIELSAEPWLIEPITGVDLETQYERMDIDKFNDILTYAKKTHFAKQYLWGGEWWYWLKLQGENEMWERGQELFLQ